MRYVQLALFYLLEMVGATLYMSGLMDGRPKKMLYCPHHGDRLTFSPAPICKTCLIDIEASKFSKQLERLPSATRRQN